jgi:hypothetical protein
MKATTAEIMKMANPEAGKRAAVAPRLEGTCISANVRRADSASMRALDVWYDKIDLQRHEDRSGLRAHDPRRQDQGDRRRVAA